MLQLSPATRILNENPAMFHEQLQPLKPNSVQDQFSPYNYPYTVKR